MSSYCEPADLYAFGLPRGSIPHPGRLAGAVSISANTVELDVHGFAQNDLVSFRAEAGGALPAPLVVGTDYYVIPVTESTFQVATASGGVAVDLTTAGSRFVVIAPLPVAATIAAISSLIDDMLPGHVVPLTAPYPEIVRLTAAELVSQRLGLRGGPEVVDTAFKRLARWAKGIPIRGTNAPTSAGLAVSAAAGYSDSRGWNTYGGIS